MYRPEPRITPWVLRLLAVNATVLLLTETLFTAPAVIDWLSFDPALALTHRPWTFLTYLVVHGGLFHLAANSLALFVFGPPVERRLGSRRFLTYYLYCGIGAALFALVLSWLMPIAPFIGASGAILGIGYAYARYLPDAELVIFPIPFPIKAKLLIWLIAGLDLFGAIMGSNDGIAHVAHLGGILAGMLWFFFIGLLHPQQGPPLPPMRPSGVPVGMVRQGRYDQRHGPTQSRPAAAAPVATVAPAPAPPDPLAIEAAELNRVLDKINATGIGSLTSDERRFLDGVSSRRRGQSPQ